MVRCCPRCCTPSVSWPCCHSPMFVIVVVFVTPELSNIAAGQSIAAAAGTMMGRRCPFCCGLAASLHHKNCNRLPIHNVNVILINYPGLCCMVQKTDVDIIQLPGGRKLVRGADISFVFLFRPLARAAATEQHSYSIVVILPSHE
jgi:hypothetical protein